MRRLSEQPRDRRLSCDSRGVAEVGGTAPVHLVGILQKSQMKSKVGILSGLVCLHLFHQNLPHNSTCLCGTGTHGREGWMELNEESHGEIPPKIALMQASVYSLAACCLC